MTVPLAAALIAVPAGTPMSIPGWNEQSPFPRHREPNGLVIGPFTGQMNPDAEGVPLLPLAAGGGGADLAAAWIFAASEALTAWSALASSTNSFSFTLIDDSVARLESTAVSSCCCVETSCCVTDCCSAVRARIAAV